MIASLHLKEHKNKDFCIENVKSYFEQINAQNVTPETFEDKVRALFAKVDDLGMFYPHSSVVQLPVAGPSRNSNKMVQIGWFLEFLMIRGNFHLVPKQAWL